MMALLMVLLLRRLARLPARRRLAQDRLTVRPEDRLPVRAAQDPAASAATTATATTATIAFAERIVSRLLLLRLLRLR